MKNLIVFGDSFNATNVHYRDTHWSELLSRKHNLNLISLASSGCSTRYVVFQILHALTIPGDNIVIGSHAASYTRVEILTKPVTLDTLINIRSFENYNGENTEESFIKSINMFTIMNEHGLTDFEKEFLSTKIPLELNTHIDRWGMFYALTKLKEANSKFSYISNLLFPAGDLFDENYISSVLGAEHVILKNELCFADYYINRNINKEFVDPGYHTQIESQEIIANKIETKLKKNGWL